jgi:hypothetical protein
LGADEFFEPGQPRHHVGRRIARRRAGAIAPQFGEGHPDRRRVRVVGRRSQREPHATGRRGQVDRLGGPRLDQERDALVRRRRRRRRRPVGPARRREHAADRGHRRVVYNHA